MNLLKKLLGNSDPAIYTLESDPSADPDDQVIGQLRGMGVELAKPRDTRHYLYFAGEAQATEAGDRIRPLGYRVEVVESAAGDGQWLVLASHDLVVSRESVVAAKESLVGACEGLDPDYDGWEAAAV
jgi:hypothetical protein